MLNEMQQSKEKTELPVLNFLLSYWLSWYLDLPGFSLLPSLSLC